MCSCSKSPPGVTMSNSTPSCGGVGARVALPWAMTLPSGSVSTSSRAIWFTWVWLRAFCSAASFQAQPTSRGRIDTPSTTASQMRRYRRWEKALNMVAAPSVLLLGEDVAHAAHGQDALGVLGVRLDGRTDAA